VAGVDAAAFRAQFPVCEHTAYFNAGTCGPMPRAAVTALEQVAQRAVSEGRATGYYDQLTQTHDRLRRAYAGVLGAERADVSVTTSTSEGIVRVLLGLDLDRGSEVLIATHEHPGLLGPLAAARDRLGLVVREVPLAGIAEAVGPQTRLVACSHVAWTTGELCPSFAGLSDELPVLLDGAQGAGAVPIDLAALGCTFYAASGQKWMCGPVGSGMLWISPPWRDRVLASAPTYVNLEVPAAGIAARAWPDGRAHDTAAMSLETAAAALAAHDALADFGFEQVHGRARALAADLAEELAAAGRELAPRGDSTLVSWGSDDPEGEAARLAGAGVIVRGFHGLPLLRASVGAWNDQADVERLLAGVTTS